MNIITALNIEAEIFIKNYKLKLIEEKPFKLYKNENINLIISGVGKINSALATSYILNKYQGMSVNFGLCGSNKYDISTIIQINKITDEETKKQYFPDMIYDLELIEDEINTHSNVVINIDKKTNIDMESSGFYQASKLYNEAQDIILIKVVSDNLDGKIDKKNISNIIHQSSSKIINIIERLKNTVKKELLNEKDIKMINSISTNLNLSITQARQLNTYYKYAKINNINKIFEKYENIKVKHKSEGKVILNQIKQSVYE